MERRIRIVFLEYETIHLCLILKQRTRGEGRETKSSPEERMKPFPAYKGQVAVRLVDERSDHFQLFQFGCLLKISPHKSRYSRYSRFMSQWKGQERGIT
jgi:hypothetical protein